MCPKKLIDIVVLAVATFGLGACGHSGHLTPDHGESLPQVFRLQMVNPHAGKTTKPEQGLNSQEADILVTTYHRSMLPEGERYEEPEQQLLLLGAGQKTKK